MEILRNILALIILTFFKITSSKSENYCPNNSVLQIGIRSLCSHGPKENLVSCQDPIRANTTVSVTCNEGYSPNFVTTDFCILRENGVVDWKYNSIPTCTTDCGYVKQYSPIDKNINYSPYGDETLTRFPWNIFIYKFNSFLPICAGVIINAKAIITVAECLKAHKKSDLTVMAGKYHQIKSEIFYNTQVSQVKNIFINEGYTNVDSGTYETTRLAFIELETLLEFNVFVAPSCIYLHLVKPSTRWDYNEKEYYYNTTGITATLDQLKRNLHIVEVKNFQNCSELKEKLMENENPNVFCTKYDLKADDTHEKCNTLRGTGLFDTKVYKYFWGLLHSNEIITLKNSTKRCINTFVDIYQQRGFISEQLIKLSTSGTIHPKYAKKYCEIKLKNILDADQLDLKCFYDGAIFPCKNDLTIGTTIKAKCKFGYKKKDTTRSDEIKCLSDAKWSDEVIECEKICGHIGATATSVPLSFKGNISSITNAPWHVAIYSNITETNVGNYTHICGGTLIHSNIVISAAHCFWNSDLNKVSDKSSYIIAAGKEHRNFYSSESKQIQYSKVLQIIVPSTYGELFYRHDLAVLLLQRNFLYNTYTKPVCLDFLPFGNYDIGDGVKGRLFGWGATAQYSEYSSQLRSVELLSLTNSNCKRLVDPNIKDQITGEKFCAKGSEGETPCLGDSGGGFLVPKIDKDGIERYYLWGVVSVGLEYDLHCTENFVSTFTNVQYHQDIIKIVIENATMALDSK